MANKKEKRAVKHRFLDDVRSKVPGLYEEAASLLPFDDVITEQWCDTDARCVGIGFDMDGRVCPSGCYTMYGARIYSYGNVKLWMDTYTSDKKCFREEYESDMPRLWALLRQIPRPVHSFGTWNGGE